MIKILFIHNQLVCGGAEQALFDLVTLMDKSKYDISVLVQYDGGIWENKFRQAGIRLLSIWDCQKKSHNLFVKLQNYYKRKIIYKAFRAEGKGLLNACVQEKYDIIVAYNGSTLQKMCFDQNAKTVKYIHGDIATHPEYCKNTLRIKETIQEFDRIICVSDVAKTSFERITGINENVIRYYNPLNSEKIKRLACQEMNISSNVPYICAVGRLATEKGYDRLIRIHKRIIDEGIYHHLVIVGNGPEKNNLLQLIKREHLEETVKMKGYQSNPYPYIKNSKFVVCSSYSEGLGLIAMEGLILGIPIISSAPAVGELFGREECGLITDNDDLSLEIGIRKMLSDESLYQRIKKGAERRSSFFDGKCMVKEIEQEFCLLIK